MSPINVILRHCRDAKTTITDDTWCGRSLALMTPALTRHRTEQIVVACPVCDQVARARQHTTRDPQPPAGPGEFGVRRPDPLGARIRVLDAFSYADEPTTATLPAGQRIS